MYFRHNLPGWSEFVTTGLAACRFISVATSELALYSAEELIDLFGLRRHCDLDLRSIRQSLGMCRLKCRTPDMVRRKLWVCPRGTVTG